ncbi:MAG: filamentous hemagglutinin N-terminal domain-containing protein [Nostoc sp. TH1S01]|nr:filamentous hemagglutinin N-terminal domain-containing protein [Nostoc sp. TH1S01]
MIYGSILDILVSKLLKGKPIMRWHRLGVITSSGVIAYTLNFTTIAMAQIVPDNSLGTEHSIVTPKVQYQNGLIERIDGGAIRGSNLFHSFQDFNVGNQQQVYFSNPTGITNILGRVTGNQASQILGRLGVLGSANLYLMNPNGIIFGRNARLDVSGSFFASTSNSLLLDNGYIFSTQNQEAPPLLTINLRPGLESWSSPQGAIANRGNLSTGQNLFLLGKNLDLQGQLRAGGNLTLQATDSLTGRGNLASTGATLIRAKGDVNFNNYQGASLQIFAGGKISINNINLNNRNLINAIAETVTLSDGVSQVSLNSQTQPIVDIRSGVSNINLPGDSTNSILPISSTNSRLTSADITINQITNQGGLVFLTNQYQPNPALSGNITVNSRLSVFGGATSGGDIVIDSRGKIITPASLTSFGIDTSTFTFSQPGGNITLLAQGDIVIPPSSRIISYGTTGGNITLKSQSAIIQQSAPPGNSLIESASFNGGQGGDVTLNAPLILLSNNVQSSLYGSATGTTGRLIINANYLEANQAQLSTFADGGNAGNIIINADAILLNNSQIFSQTEGAGDAGNITILGNKLTLDNQSLISTQTTSTEGGNINLRLRDSLSLRRGSTISAIAGNETTGANGANITINTGLLFAVPEENSDIIANAFSGSGGNVNIRAREIQGIGISDTPNSSSNITSSGRGSQIITPPLEVPTPPLEVPTPPLEVPIPPLENPIPIVEISEIGSFNEQQTNPTSVSVELPNSQRDRNNQIIPNSCRATDGNSFTITGRGGLPTDPTATIRSETFLSDMRDFTSIGNRNQVNNVNANSTAKASIVAATGWIINAQGQVKLVAALPQEGFLQQDSNCNK